MRQGLRFLGDLAKRPVSPRLVRNLGLLVPLAAAYFIAGRLGLKLEVLHPGVTAVWLPSGIALAAFVLLGYRIWPAIFVGSFLVDITVSGLVMTSVGVAIGSTIEGLVGSYLVKKFAGGPRAFDKARDVFRFTISACILGTAVSATFGVSSFYVSGLASRAECAYLWLTWWLADAIGVLLVAPFVILLFGSSHHRLDRREMLELFGLILGMILVALLVFGPASLSLNKSNFVQLWLCIPFLIWAGFRFCQLEAAGLTLLLFGSAVWGTLHGFGPFVRLDLNLSLLVLDAFIGVIGIMTMVVAALVAERRGTEAGLLGLQSILQDAVEGRTQDLAATVATLHLEVVERIETEKALRENQWFRQLADTIPAVFWLMDTVAEQILYVSPAYETIWGRSCESLYADAHSWVDAVHPEDHELALTFFDRESERDRFEVEYRIVRPDGSVRWIWDRGFVIRDKFGRICRLAGLACDITERNRLEHSLPAPQGQEAKAD